jgi:glycosyltransferase involved in cell wall biosynthesis
MRIAQIAPLTESVPPQTYGGTERVVSYVSEALVRLGHEVVLYAAGDSSSSAELRPCCDVSLRSDPVTRDPIAVHEAMMRRVLADADEFDVLHFHTGWFELPLLDRIRVPCVTTMHGRTDMPDISERLRASPAFPLVSISDAQRAPVPDVNWVATIYHGLPDTIAVPDRGERDYLAFLGRISPEKRPDLAIEIARRAGRKLKIAAKVDRVDREYFETAIAPLLAQGDDVEFLGELGEGDKIRFLAGAHALLFPIDWPEPFGLVMIEAMSCGTPVIAYPHGSVPEIVAPGVTGFVVHDVPEAVAAVRRVDTLDRHRVRDAFKRRFGAERMAADYVALFERLIDRHAGGRAVATATSTAQSPILLPTAGQQPQPLRRAAHATRVER